MNDVALIWFVVFLFLNFLLFFAFIDMFFNEFFFGQDNCFSFAYLFCRIFNELAY